MTQASESELAFSMMWLWGKDARYRARDYALDCWRKGDVPAFNRWHRVERIVELAQTAPVPYAGTVSGLHAPPKIRHHWRVVRLFPQPVKRQASSCDPIRHRRDGVTLPRAWKCCTGMLTRAYTIPGKA